jgi:class 3 adenylate cyclase
VAFGLEMLAITKSINRDLNLEGHNIWSIRVGIHTGPVITGVVGKKKFSFDIWGDTVNTAARMEQNSSTGKINISQQTSDLVSEFFTIESRGKISAKGKGQLAMYFVTGFSTAYSLNGDTSTPNQKFIDRFVKIL